MANYSMVFMEEWNSILTDCSIKLMRLLVYQEESDLAAIKVQIIKTREPLLTTQASPDFQALDRKIKENLKKLEDHITNMKKKQV